MREPLESGRCFIRYAVINDAAERAAVCAALRNWLTGSGVADPPRARAAAAGVAAPPLPHGF